MLTTNSQNSQGFDATRPTIEYVAEIVQYFLTFGRYQCNIFGGNFSFCKACIPWHLWTADDSQIVTDQCACCLNPYIPDGSGGPKLLLNWLTNCVDVFLSTNRESDTAHISLMQIGQNEQTIIDWYRFVWQPLHQEQFDHSHVIAYVQTLARKLFQVPKWRFNFLCWRVTLQYECSIQGFWTNKLFLTYIRPTLPLN